METFRKGEEIRWDGHVHPLVSALPHHDMVPKDLAGNLEFRAQLWEQSAVNLEFQQRLREMFAEDFLFFVNVCCWILEPRLGEYSERGEEIHGKVPFITWRHQDPVMAALAKYLGRRHVVGDKSRAQGASWIVICLILWAFLFWRDSTFAMCSKNEELADDVNNPDSLGWKFDFLLRHLPPWLIPPGLVDSGDGKQPNRSISKSTWTNALNGCVTKAWPATKDVARAGRNTVFFMDEAGFFMENGKDEEAVANLTRVTNGVIMISTPAGKDTEHYRRVHPAKPSGWLKVVLDWKDNPSQSKGSYTTQNGRLKVLDAAYEFPADYEYILDGRERSPWFDRQCEEMGYNYLMIDRELNRKYSATAGRPFPDQLLEGHKVTCMHPQRTGRLLYLEHQPKDFWEIEWVDGEAYRFDLWCVLDGSGCPPEDRYTLGMDISAGTGGDTSSNSVMSVWNARCEQVGELALNDLAPHDFAQLVVAAAYWFGRGVPTPKLIWERNGPGVLFSKEVERLGYRNCYYQTPGEDIRRFAKRLEKPGYFNSDRSITLDPLLSAMNQHTCVIRSHALLEEASMYEYGDNQKILHPKSKTTRDKSAAGMNHGDRVIAAAMAMRAHFEDRLQRKALDSSAPKPTDNTLAGFMLREELAAKSGGSRLGRF